MEARLFAEGTRSASEPIKETAAAHLVTAVVTADPGDTVAMTILRLAEDDHALADPIWVLDIAGRLAGVVPLTDLVAAERGALMRTLMHPPPPAVRPAVDQEKIAALAHAERISTVPVADAFGRFLGAVPPLAIIDVLKREHEEDLRRMFGITEAANNATVALELPPWRRVVNRLPWLLVGLAGSMLAAVVVARFEAVLHAQLAIAFFVPAIVYLADAIGTQTEAVAVRGLSLEHAPLGRLLASEVATGAMLGAILGILALPLSVLLFGDVDLGLAVALAIVAAGSVATAVGLVFPWLLSHWGCDPAYGSGPVATIVQDVLSLVIYFVTASLLLGP